MVCEFHPRKVVTTLHKRSMQGQAGLECQPYYADWKLILHLVELGS